MKSLAKCILGLALASSAAFYSQQASAYALVTYIGNGYVPSVTGNSGADGVLCVVLLPFCLLGDKTTSSSTTAGDLKANGYSDSSIESILEGQAAALKFLSANNLKISSKGDLTKAQLSSVLKNIDGVTADYVNFVNSNM